MSIFEDALGAARSAVTDTFSVPMTITVMTSSDYKGRVVDPSRAPLPVLGILHEHVTTRTNEAETIERTDGGRPGGRFGIDVTAAPTRISFDVADLGGWLPSPDTVVEIDRTGRRFEILHAAPQNGGRIAFYVTEITP